MESTSSARRRTKPPTRNRFLMEDKGRAFLAFPISQRVSPLRRRPKGFPVALWKPSALCCAWGIPQETDFLGQAGNGLTFLFPYHQGFRHCGGDQGAFRSFRNLNRRGVPPLVSAEKGMYALLPLAAMPAFPPAPLGAPSPKPNTGGGTAPLGAFHRLSSFIPLWSVPIPPLLQDAS